LLPRLTFTFRLRHKGFRPIDYVEQKLLDQGRDFRGPRHHEQVAVIDHAEFSVRD